MNITNWGDFPGQPVSILGYSGSILAIYFDMLLAHGFRGRVSIVKNDDRTDQESFDCGVDYQIYQIEQFIPGEEDRYLICSNKAATRIFLYNLFREKFPQVEENLMTLQHSFSYFAAGAVAAPGVVMEASTCVAPFAELGKGVFISRSSSIGHHTIIGDWTAVNPGVTIAGRCHIGEQVTIGPGTTVFSNSVIGDHTVIGGGSVVKGEIPPGVMAWGNPCKVIREQ